MDFKWVVSYYWDLHVNTNGWSDIGYNWLIDAEGTIYEGRGSGKLGAHFSCLNSFTTGICMIGNFMDTVPTDTAIAQLQRLLAWESCDKNIDPDGVSLHQPSQLMLHNISAHRDANASNHGCPSGTVCPGDSLYTILPQVRQELAGMQCLQGMGLQEPVLTDNVDIYPQPAEKELNIKWRNATVESAEIRDLRGKMIWKMDVIDGSQKQLNVNIQDWSSGTYLVWLKGNDSIEVLKFQIQ